MPTTQSRHAVRVTVYSRISKREQTSPGGRASAAREQRAAHGAMHGAAIAESTVWNAGLRIGNATLRIETAEPLTTLTLSRSVIQVQLAQVLHLRLGLLLHQ